MHFYEMLLVSCFAGGEVRQSTDEVEGVILSFVFRLYICPANEGGYFFHMPIAFSPA